MVDVLLVDDIQFLEGKESTQEEFFHTFNALHPKSQLVITSDRPPTRIHALEERLRTRFQWGLITDMQPPDYETRLAILHAKVRNDSLSVPEEVLSIIASQVQRSIRELEGALTRVAAYASLTRSEVSASLTREVLLSLYPENSNARVNADLVISVAAEYFGITEEQLCSADRSESVVIARQMAMYLCRDLTDLSLPQIGARFGGRDHSTVIYAKNKVEELLRESARVYEQMREIRTRIGNLSSRQHNVSLGRTAKANRRIG
jgi:chromosomal replication initiator protein